MQVPNLMGSEPPPPLFFDATASLVICRPSIKFVLKNSYLKQRGEAPSGGAVSSCTHFSTSAAACPQTKETRPPTLGTAARAMREGLDSHWSAREDSRPAHLSRQSGGCSHPLHETSYLSIVANTDLTLEALGPEARVLKPAARGSTHFMTLLMSEIVGSIAWQLIKWN